jgi:hypothetical protein
VSSEIPSLSELVDQLEAMSERARESVLADLTDSECARLMPLLSDQGGLRPSPKLGSLLSRCGSGAGAQLTPRVAEELLNAARRTSDDIKAKRIAALPAPRFRARIFALIGLPSATAS